MRQLLLKRLLYVTAAGLLAAGVVFIATLSKDGGKKESLAVGEPLPMLLKRLLYVIAA